jgi:hypothetical protein
VQAQEYAKTGERHVLIKSHATLNHGAFALLINGGGEEGAETAAKERKDKFKSEKFRR